MAPSTPATTSVLGNLARCLARHGSMNKALASMERVLAIREKVHGADHAETAKAASALALLLQRATRGRGAAADGARAGSHREGTRP